MNQEPAFSLIVPHRGTPRLLARLLASVPRREDTEIIIVDDCSSPASRQELREAVAACPGARLIELQEHKGAGHARNVALKEAQGRWLVFADADDYFTPPMAELMERYALRGGGQDADLVVLNALSVDERGRTSPTLLTRRVSRYLSHPSSLTLRALLYGVWTPWSRMVSRSLVAAGGLSFDETPVGNDAMFVLRASSLARRVEVEPSVCYHYYQPLEGSQTWAQYKPETFLVRLELRLRVNQFYRSVGYPFLWPLRRMMRQAASIGLSAEARQLLRRYRHTIFTELRASLSQLAGKMLGYL